MKRVQITNGTYRGQEVNGEFEVVQELKHGARGPYITVRPNDTIGVGRDKIRVSLESEQDVVHVGGTAQPVEPQESDEEIMDRIEERFDIVDEMTKATVEGTVRGMIVVGPPGVGKSYGVERILEKSSMFDRLKNGMVKYNVIKGAMTPIGLYATLYNHNEAGQVLVFDDCDSVLQEELSLNLLKAALDSGKKRTIHWNADSALLRREGIPDRFEFKGAVIFITNVNFDNIRSKKLQDHLSALQSRCHYIDLTLNTMRDKFLRIKQIHRKGDLFTSYNFKNGEADEVINFMEANKEGLNEVSLRMALKLADLIKVSKTRWQAMARVTCMKNSFSQ
jgi:hypothetical protein